MSKTIFNTDNPTLLRFKDTWKNLRTDVLGGIRLDQDRLDTLRCTLKVVNTENQKAYRSHIDLYHSPSVQRFVRVATEQIGCGLENLSIHIEELVDTLEGFRFENIETRQEKVVPEISVRTRNDALRYLRQENLHERTQADIGASGIVGEEINRMILYYIFTSRKMATPLHAFCFSPSGTGKTHLLEQVGSLIPNHERLTLTDISSKALYYLEEDALQNKLLIIEDLEGAMKSLYPIRELQSKASINRLITQQNKEGYRYAIRQQVKGPVSICGATTRDELYEDNSNRSFLLYLDESTEQTERILDYQRKVASGNIDHVRQEKTRKLLQAVQTVLQPLSVINPFAKKLIIPKQVLKPRRTNGHYLNFINAVAFYHQYQRKQIPDERTGEIFIEVTKEDIRIANELLKDVLLAKSDRLSGGCRKFFEELKHYLKGKKDTRFMFRELRIHLHIAHSTLFRYLTTLEQLGKIDIIDSDPLKGFTYELSNLDDYDKLQEAIASHLDEILACI